jgi:hypothetical protein
VIGLNHFGAVFGMPNKLARTLGSSGLAEDLAQLDRDFTTRAARLSFAQPRRVHDYRVRFARADEFLDTSNALNAAWSLIQPRLARRLFGMPNNAVAGGTRSGRAASTSLSPRFEQVAKTTSGDVTFCAASRTERRVRHDEPFRVPETVVTRSGAGVFGMPNTATMRT